MTVGLHHGMHDLQIVQEIGLRHAGSEDLAQQTGEIIVH